MQENLIPPIAPPPLPPRPLRTMLNRPTGLANSSLFHIPDMNQPIVNAQNTLPNQNIQNVPAQQIAHQFCVSTKSTLCHQSTTPMQASNFSSVKLPVTLLAHSNNYINLIQLQE